MGRKASPFTYSARYRAWLNSPNPNVNMPGIRQYKKADTDISPESRVEAFLNGTPKFNDVRTAHYMGKITTEEAQALRPNDTFPANVGMYKDKGDEATHRRARLKG